MSKYGKANSSAQWFEDKYPGARMSPNAVVVHTTEGTSWPSYSGGAVAPNYTAHPNMRAKRLDWRQHFPDERSARALENPAGGVETNTLNVVQVELVGTCDPKHAHSWNGAKAGEDYLYWPDAPDWALRDLAEFIADMHKRHGVKLRAPRFKAYPASYGTHNGVRMSNREWINFYGVCGHQHVPENHHGDPGALNMPRVLELAKELVNGKPKPKHHSKHKGKPKAREHRGTNIDAALAAVQRAMSTQHNDPCEHPVRHGKLAEAERQLLSIQPHK